ncbi:hypothetical protein BE221DRAFT_159934 [Ostreococcus tauri]|uniref:Nuclear transcription factor Y subunit n=1 Tax=Ostreococcus tauri TaxID=70448 RepID=A0A1Y5IC60_OSTTA|nr:hypothetical protein BE221DRAFT_159934 [Ostreococcus tauri]
MNPFGSLLTLGAVGLGAVYVNARQYAAIVRRRKQRAKEAEKRRLLSANGASDDGAGAMERGTRVRYASRSAHAKNRVRGPNGKYLTRAELLAGAGGEEAKARAEARELDIAERARKREAKAREREEKKRAKAARDQAARAAADAAAADAADARRAAA